MNICIEWYEEAIENKLLSFYSYHSSSDCVVYKGFKIFIEDGEYIIRDARMSDILEEVSDSDLEIIVENGFIKGVDLISYNRDLNRVTEYTLKTEKLYNKRKKWRKELRLGIDRKLNLKRLKNVEINIDEYIGQIFYYKTRVNQYKIKYKLNYEQNKEKN